MMVRYFSRMNLRRSLRLAVISPASWEKAWDSRLKRLTFS